METFTSLPEEKEDTGPVSRGLVIVGTRPEAIKMIPVIHAMQTSRNIDPYIVCTGQHTDLVADVLESAGIVPNKTLNVGSNGQTLNSVMAKVLFGVEELLSDFRSGRPERRMKPRLYSPYARKEPKFPGFTLVHGDTTSALGAGIASVHARLPVFHVEAGLRTGDILSPFPEEMNRRLLSQISSFHLSPTLANKESLIREGVRADTIFVTGNTAIDAFQWAANLDNDWEDPRLRGIDDGRTVVTVTAHRRENWGEKMHRIAEAIARIAYARPDITFVLPLHPNPAVRKDLTGVLEKVPNVILTEAMGYAPFARLLKISTLAISDSGGIQEEAPSVGTPVLVMRDNTERPEGVTAGTLKLVGSEPDSIVKGTLSLLDDAEALSAMASAENPFGDGKAATRIVQAIESLVTEGPAPMPYGTDFSRESVLNFAGYEKFNKEDYTDNDLG